MIEFEYDSFQYAKESDALIKTMTLEEGTEAFKTWMGHAGGNREVEWKKGEGKRIYCYDLRGKRVAIFRNMRDASNLLGVNSSTIASRIRTGEVGNIDNHQLYGLRFEYKNNN